MKKLFLLLTIPVFWAGTMRAAEMPPLPAQEEPEILAQGPVHEAFAEPIDLSTEAALTTQFAPPDPIVENPPDDTPPLQSVWVAGYWAWDVERLEYIWVSGCWRVVPANKRWIPGYWTETNTNWVWTSGYWATATAAVQQPQYLPPPPALQNVAPVETTLTADMIWVPPCYYWRQESYILRSGYWLNAYPGWIWQPSHYIWTPHGYVFVSGYWDYPLTARGVLYAPVRFSAPIYRYPGFSLSLGASVNLGWMELNLFSAPRYGHYFFGDYYDVSYVSLGIFPWFQYRSSWSWYNPIYEHRRWYGRKTSGNHWDDNDRRRYDHCRDDKSLRPPRTYREITAREQRERRDPQYKDVPRDTRNRPLIRAANAKTPWRKSAADAARPIPPARTRDTVRTRSESDLRTGRSSDLRRPLRGNVSPAPTPSATPPPALETTQTPAEPRTKGWSPATRDNLRTRGNSDLRRPSPTPAPETTQTPVEPRTKSWSSPTRTRDNVRGNVTPSPAPTPTQETTQNPFEPRNRSWSPAARDSLLSPSSPQETTQNPVEPRTRSWSPPTRDSLTRPPRGNVTPSPAPSATPETTQTPAEPRNRSGSRPTRGSRNRW